MSTLSSIGLQRLSPSVYLLPTAQPSPPHNPIHPKTILLFTWMLARPPHTQKYLLGYRALFPSSNILVVTTSAVDIILRPSSSLRSRLAPLLPFVSTDSDVLVHVFSNGGCCSFHQLLHLLSGPFHPRAIILDSCPGTGSFSRAVAPLAHELPKRPIVLRWLMLGCLHVYLCFMWLCYRPFGRKNIVDVAREALNDTTVVANGSRRAYLYSDADVMVLDRHVEAHAAEARARGYETVTERFVGTGHCAHVRAEPERYWGIVGRAAAE